MIIMNEVLGGEIRRRSVIMLRIVRWRDCFDVKIKEWFVLSKRILDVIS